MAPTAVSSTDLEDCQNGSAVFVKASVSTKKPWIAEDGISNGTEVTGTTPRDVIDVDMVRSHFPVLGGETIPLNNAAGTVVLKDAIERCELHHSGRSALSCTASAVIERH